MERIYHLGSRESVYGKLSGPRQGEVDAHPLWLTRAELGNHIVTLNDIGTTSSWSGLWIPTKK